MRTATVMLERLRAYDDFYVEARDAALASREVIMKQRTDLDNLHEQLKRARQERADPAELERLKVELQGLRAENSILQGSASYWEGRCIGAEEASARSAADFRTQVSELEGSISSKDQEIRGLQASLKEAEREMGSLKDRNNWLESDNEFLSLVQEELKETKEALRTREIELEAASQGMVSARRQADEAELARRAAIHNFLRSDKYKRMVAAASAKQSVEFFNRGIDAAAAKYPGVLAEVKKLRLSSDPPVIDESEFAVEWPPPVPAPSTLLPAPTSLSVPFVAGASSAPVLPSGDLPFQGPSEEHEAAP